MVSRRFTDKLDTARTNMAKLKEDAGAEGFDVIPERSPSEYRDCIDHFETIVNDLETTEEIADAIREATLTFDSATSSYDGERYERARYEFEDAASLFSESTEKVRGFEPVSSLQPLQRQMLCYSRAMISRSNAFQTAAKHGGAGEEELRLAVQEIATDPQEVCDL